MYQGNPKQATSLLSKAQTLSSVDTEKALYRNLVKDSINPKEIVHVSNKLYYK
jgi:hypothetical protein